MLYHSANHSSTVHQTTTLYNCSSANQHPMPLHHLTNCTPRSALFNTSLCYTAVSAMLPATYKVLGVGRWIKQGPGQEDLTVGSLIPRSCHMPRRRLGDTGRVGCLKETSSQEKELQHVVTLDQKKWHRTWPWFKITNNIQNVEQLIQSQSIRKDIKMDHRPSRTVAAMNNSGRLNISPETALQGRPASARGAPALPQGHLCAPAGHLDSTRRRRTVGWVFSIHGCYCMWKTNTRCYSCFH